jgi:hypothetical protein
MALTDDIDLIGAVGHRRLDLRESGGERREPVRECGRHRRDIDAGALQRIHRSLDERMIDAHRRRLHVEVADAETVENILTHRMARLGAESLDAAGRVVAVERRQVHERDGFEEPCRLPVLLHRTARADGRGAALERRAVHAHALDHIEVEREARVAIMAG